MRLTPTLHWPHLPLLVRELLGSANRRSTYVIRTLCAVIMLGTEFEAFRLYPPNVLGGGLSIIQLVLNVLVLLSFVTIPLTSAINIAGERERGTLALVLMTGMGPRRLLLQYWLGQVVLGSVLVLTALPILVMAYDCGGIAAGSLALSIAGLVLLILQLSAIGLACGCRSRGAALGAGAALGWLATIYLLLPIPLAVLIEVSGLPLSASAFEPLGLIYMRGPEPAWRVPIDLLLPLVPALVALRSGAQAMATGTAAGLADTRRYIYSASRSPYHAWNGRRFRVPGAKLPLVEPIAWRERHRGAGGCTLAPLRYFGPLLVLAVLLSLETTSSVLFDFGLLLTLFILALGAAGALPAERSGQSLEVLLTTPLPAREIVMQKFRPRRRLLWWLSGGLALLALLKWLMASLQGHAEGNAIRGVLELAAALLAPTFAVWLGLAASLMGRDLPRSLALLVCIAVLGLLVMPLLAQVSDLDPGHLPLLTLCSPWSLLMAAEYAPDNLAGGTASGWLVTLAGVALWLLGTWAVRHFCMAGAPRLLAAEASRRGA